MLATKYARIANFKFPIPSDAHAPRKKKAALGGSVIPEDKAIEHPHVESIAPAVSPKKYQDAHSLGYSELSICFSELEDDDPSTIIGPVEREDMRPQLDMLEKRVMNAAQKATESAAVVAAAMAPHNNYGEFSAVTDEDRGLPSPCKVQVEEPDDDYNEEDDADLEVDSAKSSVSSITCTIFFKSGGGRHHKHASSRNRPETTADKMEALARVVPYAAESSRRVDTVLPLSLAKHAQVQEMAKMLGLPIFSSKGTVKNTTKPQRKQVPPARRTGKQQLRGIQEN